MKADVESEAKLINSDTDLIVVATSGPNPMNPLQACKNKPILKPLVVTRVVKFNPLMLVHYRTWYLKVTTIVSGLILSLQIQATYPFVGLTSEQRSIGVQYFQDIQG